MFIDEATIGIIGGADGPTAIFVADGFGWINFFGLLLVILLLLPNLVYALRRKRQEPLPQTAARMHPVWIILEQVGRYGCMLLMVFDFGLFSLGFGSVALFLVGIIGCPALLLLYWIFWAAYLKRETKRRARMLAILPSLLFLVYGIALQHPLLIACSLVFTACHIRITWLNTNAMP